MRIPPGNDLDLGLLSGREDVHLPFPRTARRTHLYVCGSTGTGKTKFLEHLIRQDILASRSSKCGMLVLDPHGSLFDSLIRWLAWSNMKRPRIIPIDLRQDDWVVAYNVLRQRSQADPSVLVNNFVHAMAHVWGENGTQRTPLFARWASNILWALYEKKLTLLESEHLTDKTSNRARWALTNDLSNRALSQDWAYANSLSPKDFEAQIGSTVNRLHAFLSTQMLQRIFGQTGASLDLGQAMEEGDIILVNLATEKARISDEDSALFATLLLSDLWTAAKERGKGMDERDVKPFYVYMDEFQNFITPTIAKNLDQARGFGLHLTLANQFPRQILHSGAHGAQVFDSVIVNARSKVVFETRGEENLQPLAFDLFMGVMNPDEIKHELYSTKVMGYREEMRTSYSRGSSLGGGSFSGTTDTESEGGITDDDDARSWARAAALSGGHSDTFTESESETTSPMLIPIMGKELSHVQFRSLDEQLFRAMAVLFDQEQRQAVARLAGMHVPVSFHIPNVIAKPGSAELTKRYLESCYRKLQFALPSAEAKQLLANRADNLIDSLIKEVADAPVATKRRIK